ncbi:MAG: metal-dependent transcriptional regulator [Methanosarcinaceae archaeon]|nr:metal-dependent transcriptional regulator [Methanosarcinaceae archaeon]
MPTDRKEDYLKEIDKIVAEKGYAQVKDLANALDVGPSSVTGMFKKLADDGFINYEKYGGVTLTKRGKEIARTTQEKFSSINEFLKVLGVCEEIADEDACKMEHILDMETYETFLNFKEFAKTKEGKNLIEKFKDFEKNKKQSK